MSVQNLGQLLGQTAQRYPNRIAIVFGQKKINYLQLEKLTNALAAGLTSCGIKKAERIAVFLDNCPEFVISYFGIIKAGAICVPINHMFKIDEAGYILEDSQARALITQPAYINMAWALKDRIKSLEHIVVTTQKQEGLLDINTLIKDLPTDPPAVDIESDDTAVIIYTSGTTGQPKGAVLTHNNLLSNATTSAKVLKLAKADAVICILPLFHSFAQTVCMLMPLSIGAKIVIMKSARPIKRLIRNIRRNRVSIFVGIPSIFNILKDIKLPFVLNTPLIKLFNPIRLCISGAAALPVETFFGFEKKFRTPLLEGYGLTEASPVVSLNPLFGIRKPGSIGLPFPDVEVKVVDDKGNILALEQTGELIVKGPNVMKEYFKLPDATSEALKDGWLYTGDMAKIDKDGYIYIVGRKKDMINVRGLNVYPREIEELLYKNPKIKEAAVIGISDAHKGEVPKGFVVLKEGQTATERELISYLREHLAPYKIPRQIEFRDSLPKGTTGKVLKRILQEQEESGRELKELKRF